MEFTGEFMDFYECQAVGDWTYTCAPEDFAASTRGPRDTVYCSLDRFERKSNSTNQEELEAFMEDKCRERMNVAFDYALAEGVHPKPCSSNSDCRMINGVETACECGTNELGRAYCSVHPSDPLLLPMYDLACDGDLTVFYAQYLGWQYYPQTIDSIDCAGKVFNVLDAASRGNNSLTTWYLELEGGVHLLPALATLGTLTLI